MGVGEKKRKKSTQWLIFFLEIWCVFKEEEEKKVGDQTGDEKGQNEMKTARKGSGKESQIMRENDWRKVFRSGRAVHSGARRQRRVCVVGRWGRGGRGAYKVSFCSAVQQGRK